MNYISDKFSLAYVMGMVCGIVAVAIAAIIIKMVFKKFNMGGSQLKGKYYDERQKLLQGKGYKLGFYTLLISELVYGAAASVIELPFSPLVGTWGCALLSLSVFACYCIIVDAYLGVGAKVKSYIILCLLIAGLNLVSFLMNFNLTADIREVGGWAINLMCVITFGSIIVAFGVRELLGRGRDGAEDEDEEE